MISSYTQKLINAVSILSLLYSECGWAAKDGSLPSGVQDDHAGNIPSKKREHPEDDPQNKRNKPEYDVDGLLPNAGAVNNGLHDESEDEDPEEYLKLADDLENQMMEDENGFAPPQGNVLPVQDERIVNNAYPPAPAPGGGDEIGQPEMDLARSILSRLTPDMYEGMTVEGLGRFLSILPEMADIKFKDNDLDKEYQAVQIRRNFGQGPIADPHPPVFNNHQPPVVFNNHQPPIVINHPQPPIVINHPQPPAVINNLQPPIVGPSLSDLNSLFTPVNMHDERRRSIFISDAYRKIQANVEQDRTLRMPFTNLFRAYSLILPSYTAILAQANEFMNVLMLAYQQGYAEVQKRLKYLENFFLDLSPYSNLFGSKPLSGGYAKELGKFCKEARKFLKNIEHAFPPQALPNKAQLTPAHVIPLPQQFDVKPALSAHAHVPQRGDAVNNAQPAPVPVQMIPLPQQPVAQVFHPAPAHQAEVVNNDQNKERISRQMALQISNIIGSVDPDVVWKKLIQRYTSSSSLQYLEKYSNILLNFLNYSIYCIRNPQIESLDFNMVSYVYETVFAEILSEFSMNNPMNNKSRMIQAALKAACRSIGKDSFLNRSDVSYEAPAALLDELYCFAAKFQEEYQKLHMNNGQQALQLIDLAAAPKQPVGKIAHPVPAPQPQVEGMNNAQKLAHALQIKPKTAHEIEVEIGNLIPDTVSILHKLKIHCLSSGVFFPDFESYATILTNFISGAKSCIPHFIALKFDETKARFVYAAICKIISDLKTGDAKSKESERLLRALNTACRNHKNINFPFLNGSISPAALFDELASFSRDFLIQLEVVLGERNIAPPAPAPQPQVAAVNNVQPVHPFYKAFKDLGEQANAQKPPMKRPAPRPQAQLMTVWNAYRTKVLQYVEGGSQGTLTRPLIGVFIEKRSRPNNFVDANFDQNNPVLLENEAALYPKMLDNLEFFKNKMHKDAYQQAKQQIEDFRDVRMFRAQIFEEANLMMQGDCFFTYWLRDKDDAKGDSGLAIHIENGYLSSDGRYFGAITNGKPDYDGAPIDERVAHYHSILSEAFELATELDKRLEFFLAFSPAACLEGKLWYIEKFVEGVKKFKKTMQTQDDGNLDMDKKEVLNSQFLEIFGKNPEASPGDLIQKLKTQLHGKKAKGQPFTDKEIEDFVNEQWSLIMGA